ncbi:hypothetical protein HGRIS_005318 [Hohenbuehelia grisea]|uniref:Uncharacterized protein n=1 Tax=Hohenbuehelia grisea TaxID=104357 RepID=A0ABR3JGA6_9AGAR
MVQHLVWPIQDDEDIQLRLAYLDPQSLHDIDPVVSLIKIRDTLRSMKHLPDLHVGLEEEIDATLNALLAAQEAADLFLGTPLYSTLTRLLEALLNRSSQDLATSSSRLITTQNASSSIYSLLSQAYCTIMGNRELVRQLGDIEEQVNNIKRPLIGLLAEMTTVVFQQLLVALPIQKDVVRRLFSQIHRHSSSFVRIRLPKFTVISQRGEKVFIPLAFCASPRDLGLIISSAFGLSRGVSLTEREYFPPNHNTHQRVSVWERPSTVTISWLKLLHQQTGRYLDSRAFTKAIKPDEVYTLECEVEYYAQHEGKMRLAGQWIELPNAASGVQESFLGVISASEPVEVCPLKVGPNILSMSRKHLEKLQPVATSKLVPVQGVCNHAAYLKFVAYAGAAPITLKLARNAG